MGFHLWDWDLVTASLLIGAAFAIVVWQCYNKYYKQSPVPSVEAHHPMPSAIEAYWKGRRFTQRQVELEVIVRKVIREEFEVRFRSPSALAEPQEYKALTWELGSLYECANHQTAKLTGPNSGDIIRGFVTVEGQDSAHYAHAWNTRDGHSLTDSAYDLTRALKTSDYLRDSKEVW